MSRDIVARNIQTSTHGRYLTREPARSGRAPVLVGFHGYAEPAEAQLERLMAIPGSDRWLLVSIQGLHRFYQRRTDTVVSSWMTRQDRELALADNTRYVEAVLDAVADQGSPAGRVVFAGFSQGVAMAFRAACASPRRVEGLIALGGDVPPELDRAGLGRLSNVLLGRGERDEWYTAAKWSTDMARLREAGVNLETSELDAGHEWTADFSGAAGAFLDQRFS